MTGIDRLRTLAGEWDAYGLGGTLGDVARQIERERACDADTIENVRLIVGGVVTDMERHILGHEGMDDSPVSRWARELREALGGKGNDPTNDVSMSAYDLLPNEDREAVAWVREHGGLERVKGLLDWVVGHCSTRQQLDFDFWLSGRVMYELGFEEDVADRDEVERRLLARLMPDGMEWPRYTDGSLVEIGDEVVGPDYGEHINVDAAKFHANGFTLFDKNGFDKWYESDDRFERPTPKVLDADGVEIRVGDVLYRKSDGHMVKVVEVDEKTFTDADDYVRPGEGYTHRAPVIAGDGKPLREGEKPYRVDNGKQVEIRRIDPSNGESCVFVGVDGRSYGYWLRPGQLTHELPESWERLEEDAKKGSCDYFGCDSNGCHGCPAYGWNTARGGNGCGNAKTLDLVRRAKRLAERGQ